MDFGEYTDDAFECRAYVRIGMAADTCQGESKFILFLSINGDGNGYFMVTGNYTCPSSNPVFVDEIVDFTYKKERGYDTIQLGPRSHEIVNIFDVLKYDDIKIKIMQLDTYGVYQLDSPLRTPTVCRRVDNVS
ncbi:hypothetical protein ACV1BL_25255 (plasmid) [Serratia marcescens]